MSTDRDYEMTATDLSEDALREPIPTPRRRAALRVVRPSVDGEIGWRRASLARLESPYPAIKTGVERVAGLLLFVISLPAMLVIAGLIRVRMGPGVLYTQERVGRDGLTFRIVKFRTMDTDRRCDDADLEFVGEDRRVSHKTVDDPRHTRLGTMLRRSSLDELPQLWNVVRGDMVLVGPRPELASVVEKYRLWAHPRHQLKPGITGLWQVSEFRHELLHEHMDVDLDYIERMSVRTDLWILLRTLMMPFDRTGS